MIAKTRYLTPEQVLFLHSRLIKATGGRHGIRNLEMLLSALRLPQAASGNRELYPDLFTKTAVLLDSLVRLQPFVDGNTRTAITTAGIFLKFNSQRLIASHAELVRFALVCDRSQLSLGEIARRLNQYSRPEK